MRRPLWLGAGVVVGVGGTLWTEARVRRRIRAARERLGPNQLAAGALGSARQVGERVRGAVEAGRSERDRREDELRRDLAAGPRRAAAPGGARTRR